MHKNNYLQTKTTIYSFNSMEQVTIKISNEELQKIRKKLEIKSPVKNSNLVRFAVNEFLKQKTQ